MVRIVEIAQDQVGLHARGAFLGWVRLILAHHPRPRLIFKLLDEPKQRHPVWHDELARPLAIAAHFVLVVDALAMTGIALHG